MYGGWIHKITWLAHMESPELRVGAMCFEEPAINVLFICNGETTSIIIILFVIYESNCQKNRLYSILFETQICNVCESEGNLEAPWHIEYRNILFRRGLWACCI